MSGNIPDYYDNERPTKFNDSTLSSIDNTDLSLNAIYEYEGRTTRLYMGSAIHNDIDGYVNDSNSVSTLAITAYPTVNNKWTKRDNFYFCELFKIPDNGDNGDTMIFSMVFNAYKNNQYYNKNFEGGYWITSEDPSTPSSMAELYLHLGGTGPTPTNTNITAETGSDSDKIVSINGTYDAVAENHFTS